MVSYPRIGLGTLGEELHHFHQKAVTSLRSPRPNVLLRISLNNCTPRIRAHNWSATANLAFWNLEMSYRADDLSRHAPSA